MTRFIAEPVITAPWNASSVGPRRNLLWRVHLFSEFREIRQAFGGTINDIALAVVCEAAARYLKVHNENVEGRNLRLMCPVNVRRADETGSLGNRVSAIFPILAASPMEMTDRLKRVRWETEHIKQNRDAQAMELMMETVPQVPPFAMAQTLLVGTRFDPTALAARMPLPVLPQFLPRPPLMGFNFTCINVPGAQTAQYLCGHEVTDTIGVLMLGGTLGYGVAVGSYNQKIYFNFVCDPRLLPDLDVMANSADDAFTELLASARSEMQAQSKSKSKSKTKTRSTDVS
ncbi:MAG: WS/DGAT domain-containing protein [Proteobacteria bacterium]|nr:WS/DGAT domain-containing protein [Pseudomonadota bacterium]